MTDKHSDSPRGRIGLALAGLHLAAVSAFALAQPLFDVFGRDATFFVAHRVQASDLMLVAALLVIVAPAAVWLVEVVLSLISSKLQSSAHLLFMWGGVTLVVLPPARQALEGSPIIALALAAVGGILTTLAYAKLPVIRTFCTVLSAAGIVFAGTFFLQPGIQSIVSSSNQEIEVVDTGCETSLVMVIFDEFPLATILNADMEVDADLFPNFARLASHSIWYRNTTAVHASSEQAIPAVMTGNRPEGTSQLALAADHPQSVFTLLGGSHRMRVFENFTALLPDVLKEADQLDDELPLGERMKGVLKDMAIVYGHIVLPEPGWIGLPDISGQWSGFGNKASGSSAGDAEGEEPLTADEASRKQWMDARNRTVGQEKMNPIPAIERFIDALDGAVDPSLYFLHVLMPHQPWTLTPWGKRYAFESKIAGYTLRGKGRGFDDDPWPPALAYQRHMFQAIQLDKELGKMIDRMEETGLYDECVFAVVADHGASFRPGKHLREPVQESMRDIMHVPFFLKLPGRSGGQVDDQNLEGIDVLPTIASALGIDFPWPVDGRSAFDASTPARSTKSIGRNRRENLVLEDVAMPSRLFGVDEKVRLFGELESWRDLYRLSTRPDWLGRAVSELAPDAPNGPCKAEFYLPDRFEQVDPDSQSLPSYVEGTIVDQNRDSPPRELIIAVEGRVQAVIPTFRVEGNTARFAAMLPDDSFRLGYNRIEVFSVEPDNRILRVASPGVKPTYVLASNGVPEIRATDGQVIPVSQSTIRSAIGIARVEDGELELAGWAIDTDRMLAPDRLLVFAEGVEEAVVSDMAIRRPDAVRAVGAGSDAEYCGFQLSISLRFLDGDPTGRLRIFALVAGEAMELRYGPNGRWLTGG